jgi:hypothetical protein
MPLFSLGDFDARFFPASYAIARQEWLEQLNKLNTAFQHKAFSCDGKGPDGEELITDSVWIGDVHAKNALVMIAGTHGIEGFAGSAIQIDLLRQLAAGFVSPSVNTAILLIHALTPWGYAWLRRCDANGVDLNRNAVDFSLPLPENPNYLHLRSMFFNADYAERQAAFSAYLQEHGRIALEKAISGGQYIDPNGPFYGGQEPAHGRLVCEALNRHYRLQERRLAVIDLHTGLGSYGYGEIICDHPPLGAGATVAQKWYGDSVTLPLAGTSSSVPKLGLLDYLWHALMNSHSCFITLEFGTYSTDRLFEILLRDHQLWAMTNNYQERREHSQVMKQHFCPDDLAWRELVLFRGRQVISQALFGLAS